MIPTSQSAGPKLPRVRDTGLALGALPPGALNAITDVPGILVGQETVLFGDGPLQPGKGPARTGVTVILPHPGNCYLDRVPAAAFVFNGFGKCLGLEQLDELGLLETPIALTSTLSVPRVADGLITHAIRQNPGIGITLPTVNPFVGECSDAWLNDIQGRHAGERESLKAIDAAAAGPVAEGSVGAGVGMSAFGFKGGIGTASRRLPDDLGGWTIGVLVLANFGRRGQLVIDGVPVGRLLDARTAANPERGSIMIVIGTDAPLLDRQLRRLARRAPLGMARTGSTGGHGSGDVAIAFSTAVSVRHPFAPERLTLALESVAESGPGGASSVIDGLFAAVVEATEEAILNALFRAVSITGRDGNTREALPVERVVDILEEAGRLPRAAR
jgi:D-aminopeptidase